MSFNAYRKKNNGKLEMPNYMPKKCNAGHLPYPQGQCSKCQPGAVSLQRQEFRFVDHVEFASAAVVEKFIERWRKSGKQVFGIMYGKWGQYTKAPLGIKVQVEVIYVPTQESSSDWVEAPETIPEDVEQLAQYLGLQQVGMIWTDLEDAGNGRVLAKRHANSWFLSGQEAIFCAMAQNKHLRKDGYGSRFVTCVISGNEEGEVHVSAYQVSNTAQAMVQAGLIEASTNPALIRVRDIHVMYTQLNEYGRVTQHSAPCFPVAYLLVSVGHGFPRNPSPLFPPELDVEGPLDERTLRLFFDKHPQADFAAMLGLYRLGVSLQEVQAFSWVCERCTFINRVPGTCAMCHS